MPWQVYFHGEFEPEFDAFAEEIQNELLAHANLLRALGPQLKRPTADTLYGSKHSNMKELRFKAAGGVWRVAFAFDPEQKAILLIGGDKSGGGEKRFYRQLIRVADARFDRHLASLEAKSSRKGPQAAMKTLEQKLKEISRKRQARIKARTRQLVAREMSLRELRHAVKKTQKTVARTLNMGQEGVSRLEKRSDLLLSTLRNYVEAVGGSLTLVAQFPDQEPIAIQRLGDVVEARETGRSNRPIICKR